MSTPSSDYFDKIAAITKRIDDLNHISKLSTLIDQNNSAALYPPKTISALTKQIEALNQVAALNKSLGILNTVAEINERHSTINKIIHSFNLYPTKSFETCLKTINYPSSIASALAKDWHKIGNDLWKSYLSASSSQPSNDHE